MDGLLLIDKEAGVSSRHLDNFLSHKLGARKAGHLGTLDPFATGLLIVGVNKGTKAFPYIDDTIKTYEATLKLGEATSSGDKDGEVIDKKEVPSLSKGKIEEALSSFLGDGLQTPPMTSAIKVDGKPLYKLAHRGEEIERAPRPIHIYSLDLLSFDKATIIFKATVSKGTYIRVLGEDIAKRLGTLGHLLSLRRLSIGDIKVENAKKADEILPADLHDAIAFIRLPKLEIDDVTEKKARDGLPICLNSQEERVLLVHQGYAVSVYRLAEEGLYRAERGLF